MVTKKEIRELYRTNGAYLPSIVEYVLASFDEDEGGIITGAYRHSGARKSTF